MYKEKWPNEKQSFTKSWAKTNLHNLSLTDI